MITVQRKGDESYEVVTGAMQLKVQLDVHGTAEVMDISTGQTLHVHDVAGELLLLSDDAQANLEDQANAMINRACR